jgi:PBSX family phage terminase large subunit
MPEVELTEPQERFFDLECRFPLFCGGYGSGKTEAKLLKALAEKFEEPESHIALYDPTYDLARLNTVPRLLHILDQMPVNYHYDKQANIVNIDNYGKFIIRTLENPARIVGYEVWRSHVDELDTLKPDNAEDAWNKIIARNRQRIKSGADNRVSVYTTPEGFRFCYNRWILKGGEGYQFVQAPTRSNPHLPEGYIESLKRTYPENLLSAYLEGQFVNLTSGTVYASFDRARNHTDVEIKPHEPLYIGCDFNVTKQAAVVHVMRGGVPHAVDELVDMYDTPAMIDTIKERYPEHSITIYPDASGKSRKTVNASESDISLLRQAGFKVRAYNRNPAVKDRVAAVNNVFEKGRYFVNTNTCKEYTRCLEQLTYDKNGQPDKESGLDHITDAAGYFVAYEYPIARRTAIVQPVSLY